MAGTTYDATAEILKCDRAPEVEEGDPPRNTARSPRRPSVAHLGPGQAARYEKADRTDRVRAPYVLTRSGIGRSELMATAVLTLKYRVPMSWIPLAHQSIWCGWTDINRLHPRLESPSSTSADSQYWRNPADVKNSDPTKKVMESSSRPAVWASQVPHRWQRRPSRRQKERRSTNSGIGVPTRCFRLGFFAVAAIPT